MLAAFLTRLALLAFPRPFRDRVGRPLVQTLLTDCRTISGRLAYGRLAMGATDIVVAGLAERLAQHRHATAHPSRRWSDILWQDIRYSARRLNRQRGFTAVALLTLALGIGANTALFQLLDAVAWRTLPIPHPRELAEIRIASHFPSDARGSFSMWHADATNAIWEQIRDRQDAFSGVFAWSSETVALEAPGRARQFVSTLLVSGGYFPVLGLRPALGRLLTDADDTRGCTAPAMVLSDGFWQQAFGGDPSIIGRLVTLDRATFHVVGVAPREFNGLEVGSRFDVAVPLCAEGLPPGSASRLDPGPHWFLVVMGRLKSGMSLSHASARLAAISPAVFDASLPPTYPRESTAAYRSFQLGAIDASTGISMLRDQYTGALWLLQATAALLLLLGCANLANLMLARAAARERELAARAALGARRGHLVRVVITESVLLSIAGAVLGIALAKAASGALVRFLEVGAHAVFLSLPIDWRVLGLLSAAAAATCLLSGLGPALRAAAVSPVDVLRAGGTRSITERRHLLGPRQILVIAQIALSLVLLTGALLFARSLRNLVRQDLGFQPAGLTIAYVDMSRLSLPAARQGMFTRSVIATIAATPGVVSAAETTVVPLSGSASENSVWLDGVATPVRQNAYFADVGADYFKTLQIPLLEGRAFDEVRDTPGAPPVAIVNAAFIRKFVPSGHPIGKRVWREARPGLPETRYDIVGVVKDAKYLTLRQDVPPTIYVARSQEPPGAFAQLLVRTSLPPPAAQAMIERVLHAADPAIVPTFSDFETMVDRLLTEDTLLAALSGFFGALAIVLATVGLYGSLSFAVARRTREIGTRIALGASRAGIFRLVLREASILVAAGCVIGGGLTVALARAVGALVYAVAPEDPVTIGAALALLMLVAVAASLVPAARAARVDPTVAFRAD